MKVPDDAEAWLQKLEEHLRQNPSNDIIYAMAIGHRSGHTALVANVLEDGVRNLFRVFEVKAGPEPTTVTITPHPFSLLDDDLPTIGGANQARMRRAAPIDRRAAWGNAPDLPPSPPAASLLDENIVEQAKLLAAVRDAHEELIAKVEASADRALAAIRAERDDALSERDAMIAEVRKQARTHDQVMRKERAESDAEIRKLRAEVAQLVLEKMAGGS